MYNAKYQVTYDYDYDDKLKAIKAIRDFSGLGLKEAKEIVEDNKPITDLTYEEAQDLCNKFSEYGIKSRIEEIKPKATLYKVLLTSYDKDRREDMRMCLTKEFSIRDHSEAYKILDDIDNGEKYVLAEGIDNVYEAKAIGDSAKLAGGIVEIETESIY